MRKLNIDEVVKYIMPQMNDELQSKLDDYTFNCINDEILNHVESIMNEFLYSLYENRKLDFIVTSKAIVYGVDNIITFEYYVSDTLELS